MQKILKSTIKIFFSLVAIFGAVGVLNLNGTVSFFSSETKLENSSVSVGFWVKPEVEVKWTGCDDEIYAGNEYEIKWEASAGDIEISYTCDGGKTFFIIKNQTENDGKYLWQVPDILEEKCRVQVEATDENGLLGKDDSGDFSIVSPIVLNEFLPKPATGKEWVEIYNQGEKEIDMSDWEISELTGGGVENKYKISSLSVLGGGDYKIKEKDFLVVEFSGSKLNDSGDTISLYDKNGIKIDHYKYTSSQVDTGKTIARIPDGADNWVDPVPTPGKKNKKDDDMDDFRKYYKIECFDKKGEALCEEDFLKKLGLWEELEESTAEKNPQKPETNEKKSSENLIEETKNEEKEEVVLEIPA